MPRTDTGSRVIAAPPEQVYDALVDREALTEWLPPEGMTARFERFDPRPGGSYRLVLTYRDASGAEGKATADSDVVEGRYVDMVPGERVVQAIDFVRVAAGPAGRPGRRHPGHIADLSHQPLVRGGDQHPPALAGDNGGDYARMVDPPLCEYRRFGERGIECVGVAAPARTSRHTDTTWACSGV